MRNPESIIFNAVKYKDTLYWGDILHSTVMILQD